MCGCAPTLGTLGPVCRPRGGGSLLHLWVEAAESGRSYPEQMARTGLAADLLVPGALAGVGLLELLLVRPDAWVAAAFVELVAACLLGWRRAYPLVSTTASAVILLSLPWFGPQLNELSTPILFVLLASYSLGRWIADRRGLVGIGLILTIFLADYLFVDLRAHNWTDILFVSTLVLPPYVFGRITRRLAVQATQLEANQEVIRRQAIAEERSRIARELHDVIAHSVSAMVVQTAAAQDLVRTDPDRAEAVLADVAATGRRALAETGRLLHVIRDEADELGLAPAPGLGQLPELLTEFRANGLAIEAEIDDSLPVLPAGVDVSAYRIVAEALTNALRYGADRTVRLRVAGVGDTLSIQASNPAQPGTASGTGLGLLGMRERVALLGGTLTSDIDAGGRFVLSATLPVRASVSPR